MTRPSGRSAKTRPSAVSTLVSPGASVPRSQVTVPPASAQPDGSEVISTRNGLPTGSLMITSVAGSGPWLVTATVYLIVPPGSAWAGATLSMVSRACWSGRTMVCAQSGFGSLVSRVLGVTVPAQLVICESGAASAATTTVNVRVLVSPTARSPTAQETVLPCSSQPGGSEVTVSTDVSMGSLTVTSVAGSGPRLSTS